MSSETPLVSVIVAARNASAGLERLLDCLQRQTHPRERLEVIVVDDCSTDDSAAVVRRSPIATLLSTPTRGGAYAARNVGLRAARGEIIAITDADCEPDPRWIEGALEDLAAERADLVGGHVEIPLSPRPTVAELIDVARYNNQERIVLEGGFASTSSLIARREVFDRVGEFNERTISLGDREFSLRATGAGFKLAFSPRSVVVHAPRRRGRELIRKTLRMGIGRSQLRAHARGPIREQGLPRIWTRPGTYLIRPGVYGLDLLRGRGYRPGWVERRKLELGEYFYVQLPLALGSLAGSWREARRRLRPRPLTAIAAAAAPRAKVEER